MNRIKRATMTDVALKAGVSQTTVSFVLNDIDAGLPERTRQKVLEAAKELNYSPNDAARRLASQKSKVIGLAIYDISDILTFESGAASVLASVYRAAERKGQRLAIYTTHERDEAGQDLETYYSVPVRSKQVDGIVVWDYYLDPNRLLANFNDGLPIVTLDRQVDDVPCVVPDYDYGMNQVINVLQNKGHRKICLMTRADPYFRDVELRAAFDKAVQQAGIPQENIVYKVEHRPTRADETIVESLVDEVLQMPDRPTAIVCGRDQAALVALMRLQVRGVKVPEEMAVVGFGGLPITGYQPFNLSTVDIKMEMICSHAVNLVLQMVKGEQLAGTRIMVQPQFVARETT